MTLGLLVRRARHWQWSLGMSIFDLINVFGTANDEMAKKAAAKVKPRNERLVAEYCTRLAKTGTDRAAFEAVCSDFKGDDRLASADIIAIAHTYVGGGKKPSSRDTAYSAISKRFVEIVRFHAKNQVAAKARPW
jgi:hypothetical protein